MGNYKELNNEKNSLFKKYKKYLKKAITGGIIAALALAVSPYILFHLNDLVAVKSISDTLFAGTVLGAGLLTGYGAIKSVVNGIKAKNTRREYEEKCEEADSLSEKQEYDLEKLNEKNKELSEKIVDSKDYYYDLKSEITKDEDIKLEKEDINNDVLDKQKTKKKVL